MYTTLLKEKEFSCLTVFIQLVLVISLQKEVFESKKRVMSSEDLSLLLPDLRLALHCRKEELTHLEDLLINYKVVRTL